CRMAPRRGSLSFALLVCVALDRTTALEVSALWQDQTEEFLDRCVPAEDFPKEIAGSLYFAGPSLWSLGGQEVRHAFDGLGRLHKLYYDAPRRQLCHSARFILGPGNAGVLKSCDLTRAGNFARVKGAAWWTKLPLLQLLVSNLDNTWVNQLYFPTAHLPGGEERLELMTDSSPVLLAETDSLDIKRVIHWNDTLVQSILPVAPLSTAHPSVHPVSGDVYNIFLDAGLLSNDVVLFRRSGAEPERRQEVARIPVGRDMLLQHSFALSAEYAILFAHPFSVDLAKVATGADLLDAMGEWGDQQNFTRLLVVDLAPERYGRVQELRVAPFTVVHVANAYRDGDALVLDVEGRPMRPGKTTAFYKIFQYEFAKDPAAGSRYFEEQFVRGGYGLYRFVVPLSPGTAVNAMGELPSPRKLLDEPLAFPTIAPQVAGKAHCFIWGVLGDTFEQIEAGLVKVDVCSGGAVPLRWGLPGHAIAAAIAFVPRAAEVSEDAGWLLVPLHHQVPGGRSLLAVINAQTMTQVSLVPLKQGDVLNWSAHSTFVAAAPQQPRGDAAVAPTEVAITTVRDAIQRCAALASGTVEF
ncbi:unnamed protein product, partial [Polarella glacialis]